MRQEGGEDECGQCRADVATHFYIGDADEEDVHGPEEGKGGCEEAGHCRQCSPGRPSARADQPPVATSVPSGAQAEAGSSQEDGEERGGEESLGRPLSHGLPSAPLESGPESEVAGPGQAARERAGGSLPETEKEAAAF